MLVAIIFVYFYQNSPEKNEGFFPFCFFKLYTGLDCVGCGGQRAVHELLHLNFSKALSYNALFVLSLPMLATYIFYSLRRYIYGKPSPDNFWYTWKFGLTFIIIVLLFLVLRNIPIEPFIQLNSSY